MDQSVKVMGQYHIQETFGFNVTHIKHVPKPLKSTTLGIIVGISGRSATSYS